MTAPATNINKMPSAIVKVVHTRLALFTYAPIVLVAAIGIGTNVWQLYAGQQSSSQVASLTTQVSRIKSDIASLTAQNNGTVAPPAKSTLPANQVGLISYKITLTLPAGWVEAPLSSSPSLCMPGSIFAKPVCDDLITLLPSALVNTDQNTHYVYSPFEVDISVFAHTDSTNAKDWLSQDYGEDLEHTDEPQAIDESVAPINGYDGFMFISRYSDTPYPSTIFYSVVHGSYAVAVRSTFMTTVNPTGTAGNDVNEDYSKYLLDIKALVNSITFHG